MVIIEAPIVNMAPRILFEIGRYLRGSCRSTIKSVGGSFTGSVFLYRGLGLDPEPEAEGLLKPFVGKDFARSLA